MKPTLLVFGQATSGKTTLAQLLVQKGFYDLYLEADDWWRYVSGLKKPWREDENPKISLHRSRKNETLALAVSKLQQRFSVVVTGLWPVESRVLLEKVQDYQVIVLDIKGDETELKKRWLARGSDVQDLEKSGVLKYFAQNRKAFLSLAWEMSEKGKLCTDKRVLNLVWKESIVLPPMEPERSS